MQILLLGEKKIRRSDHSGHPHKTVASSDSTMLPTSTTAAPPQPPHLSSTSHAPPQGPLGEAGAASHGTERTTVRFLQISLPWDVSEVFPKTA